MFCKVVFKIKIDKDGAQDDEKDNQNEDKWRSTCILLNKQLTLNPEAEQVMFCMPYFRINEY